LEDKVDKNRVLNKMHSVHHLGSLDSDDDTVDSLLNYQPFQVKSAKKTTTKPKSGTKKMEEKAAIKLLKQIPFKKVGHQYYPTLEVVEAVWLGTWDTSKSFKVVLTDGKEMMELLFHPDHAKRLGNLILKKKKKMVAGARIKLENYFMKEDGRAMHGRIIVASRIRTMRQKVK
jgi:hypothetical protein